MQEAQETQILPKNNTYKSHLKLKNYTQKLKN